MNSRSKEYVLLCFIALLCAISSAKSIKNVDNKGHCYIKTSRLKVVEENVCSIDYDEEACVEPTQFVIDFINEDKAEITKSQTNAHSSLVSVSVSTVISGEILFLIINGVASHSKSKRCVFVKFHVLSHTNDSVTLHADHLQLPNGSYNITAISLQKTESLAKKASIQYVVHKSFDVGKTEVRSNDDECTCNNCIEPFHHYQEDSGLLQLFSNVSEKLCSNFSVNLLKYNDPSITTEKACLKLNITVSTMLKTDFIRPTRYSNEMPIDFPNIHAGCYIMRMITGMFYGFFWLESTNTILIDSWNTTILLIPRSLDHSVEVTWTSPFNFTLWNLELWYVRDDKVSCKEEKSRGELIDVFGPDKVLSTSTYIFKNLKIGYYCARIYPIDQRCPRSRCSPRSSTTIQLTEMSFERENEISISVWVVPILVISSLVVGMCLSFFLYITLKSSTQPRLDYNQVSMKKYQMEPIRVLFIWTRSSLRKDILFEKVLDAFKNLLRTYSNCKVFDYLDYASLDFRERQMLLDNPTEWLQKHFLEPLEKIIFVGYLSRKSMLIEESNEKSLDHLYDGPEASLDNLLFPFALRYLRETSELSFDYRRIFYVRFDGLSVPEKEFQEIVPSVRFTIPTHLKDLTVKMRGFSADMTQSFPNPPEKQVKNLQNLINDCLNSNLYKIDQ